MTYLPYLSISIDSYKNRPNMNFGDVQVEADQEFELHPDKDGSLEYSTK